MSEEQIKKLIQEEVEKKVKDIMESLLGRTIVQLRQFFLKNII